MAAHATHKFVVACLVLAATLPDSDIALTVMAQLQSMELVSLENNRLSSSPPPKKTSTRQRSAKKALAAEATFDHHRLSNLCGPLDQNLRAIEAHLGVSIQRRHTEFQIQGDRAEQARAALEKFYEMATRPISIEDIALGLASYAAQTQPSAQAVGMDNSDVSPQLSTRKTDLVGRTPTQRLYLRNILSHDISFGIGPAGTGKTYLAVACAVDALERDAVKRIVLTRPAVEAGERLGFLPGDLAQKVDPYLRPLYDALHDLLGTEKTARLFEKQIIEIAPLAYMRGRTLNHAFIILDEAQNTTPEQMKMFLTRIGFGSRAVVTGDVTQIDLPKHQTSGLIDSAGILRRVGGISFTEFSSKDVVRHPLVAKIVDAYEQQSAQANRRRP
jgi:phosphate starvation-inducible protein PhoH and related proteins